MGENRQCISEDVEPYAVIVESEKLSGYQWDHIFEVADPHSLDFEVHRIALKQKPTEKMSIEFKFNAEPNKQSADEYCYRATCSVIFYNDLHLFSQDFAYEILCERFEGVPRLPEQLFTMLEKRNSERINNIQSHFTTNQLIRSEQLRLCVRRQGPADLKSDAKPRVDFRTQCQSVSQDIVIRVEDKKISAHKFVLSYKSEVFRAIFRNPKVNALKIEGYSSSVVKKMLHYVYTDEVESARDDSIYDLYRVGYEYALRGLCRYCEEHMLFNCSRSKIVKTLASVDVSKTSYLKSCLWNFVQAHAREMIAQPDFVVYLCQSMNKNSVVQKLLFAIEHELSMPKEKAIEYIAQKYTVMKDNTDFLELFQSHPTLMKEIYLFYCNRYASMDHH